MLSSMLLCLLTNMWTRCCVQACSTAKLAQMQGISAVRFDNTLLLEGPPVILPILSGPIA